MLILLIAIAKIYTNLNIRYFGNGAFLLIRILFSIYLAWISVATIANVSALLVSIGWEPWSTNGIYWTVAMLVVASLLAGFIVWTRKDLAYLCTILWAVSAIVVKRQTASVLGDTLIIYTIYGLIGGLILVTLVRLLASNAMKPS